MTPKYILLKEKINQDILKDVYPIGTKLPTEVELSEIYNVSRSTVRQALGILVDQGIIEKKWGSGNTVITKSDSSKSKTVMLILKEEAICSSEEYYSDLVSQLLKNGFQTEIHITDNRYHLERSYLNLLLEEIYAGLIIDMCNSNLPSTNVDLIQLLLKRQTPIVFIESAPAGIYNPTVISLDDYNRGYQMARKLINRGYKKLGGIFTVNDKGSSNAFSGFVDAIRDADLSIFDECFLWSHAENNASINRFMKNALSIVSAVYLDDNSISLDGTFPVFTSDLTPAKSIGKECASALITIKKNGDCKSVTIPYK